ncbi:hypothetical protein, partial [Acidaminococcus sp. AM05-11]|uniref:hypothetical protein n=1 Tax=Acidaminococcus sp. AM05-11 TaxID=2291997 RepID=UPI001F460C89
KVVKKVRADGKLTPIYADLCSYNYWPSFYNSIISFFPSQKYGRNMDKIWKFYGRKKKDLLSSRRS